MMSFIDSNKFLKNIYFGIASALVLKPKSFLLLIKEQFTKKINHNINIYSLWNNTQFYVRNKSADSLVILEVYVRNIYPLPKTIPKVVIDLGAHTGIPSIYYAKYGARVYAYEPSSQNYKLLKKNIALNNLTSKIIPFKTAVSKKKTIVTFFEDDNMTTNSLIYKNKNSKKIKVQAITLKDVFDNNKIERCDLIKIDIEGAEYGVLESFPKEYFRKIKSFCIEYHEDSERLVKILKKNNFSVRVVESKYSSYTSSYIYADNKSWSMK